METTIERLLEGTRLSTLAPAVVGRVVEANTDFQKCRQLRDGERTEIPNAMPAVHIPGLDGSYDVGITLTRRSGRDAAPTGSGQTGKMAGKELRGAGGTQNLQFNARPGWSGEPWEFEDTFQQQQGPQGEGQMAGAPT